MTGDPVARLRELCLALPTATEKFSHGEAAFFAGTAARPRQFVMVDQHHGSSGPAAGHVGFWCAAPPGAQEALLATDPERFYRPPYVGHRGWVGVRIDLDPDWDEIGEIVREAWAQVVPAALQAGVPGRR